MSAEIEDEVSTFPSTECRWDDVDMRGSINSLNTLNSLLQIFPFGQSVALPLST